MRRKLFIIASASILLLVLLLGLLLVSPGVADPVVAPVRALLVRSATKRVSQALNGSVEIGAVRGSLLSSSTLHDIVLRNPRGTVVGRIDAVHLRYDLKGLWKKRLLIHSIEIVRPRLTLVQDADGQLNLTRLLSPGPPHRATAPQKPSEATGFPLLIELQHLSLRDGQCTLRLPAWRGVQTQY